MTGARTTPSPLVTSLPVWLGAATSMSTEPGVKRPTTDPYGFRLQLRRDGRLIALDTGPGSLPGDGPGSTMRRGDSLPSTMAAGYRLAVTGAGLLDLTMRVLITLPRWWLGLAARGLALASASVADLAGARSGWGEPFFPWYGASRGYFRNVNISNTHITNITNITNNYYNNRNGASLYGKNGIQMPRYARTGALTAASRNTLERGLPVASNAARVSPNALRNLSSISRPDVSPTRANMLGPKAGLPAAKPSAGITSRPTVSRMTPPANSARPTGLPSTGTSPAPNIAKPSPGRVAEGPSTSARSMPGPAGRFVPRPPQSFGTSNTGAMSSRGVSSPSMNRIAPSEPAQTAMNHNVPRPPQSGTRSVSGPSMARPGVAASTSPSRSVPRPPEGSVSRPTMSARNTVPNSSAAPRSYSTPYFGRGTPSSAPRPSGQIAPAPRAYPSAQNRGGSYSARSYNGGGYGNYGGYRRGYSAPSYGGSYGGRGYSGPSYGGSSGGHSYSAPSSHSSGSFGGYHASSGGSHASSGGGSSHGGHGR